MIIFARSRHVEWNFQPSVFVQTAFAFLHHVVAVTVIIVLVLFFAFAKPVFFLFPPPGVIRRTIDVILDVGVFDRRAEKVFGFDGEFGLFADCDKRFWRRDSDFVFGLLVFGDFKITASRFDAVQMNDQAVTAKRRSGGDVNFAVESSARSERQIFLQNFLAVLISDSDVNCAGLQNLVTAFADFAKYAFEVSLLVWTINRAVGVNVTGQIARRRFFAFVPTEVIRGQIGNGKISLAVGHNQVIVRTHILIGFRFGGGVIQRLLFFSGFDVDAKQSILVALPCSQNLVAFDDFDFGVIARFARFAINRVNHHFAVLRNLADHRQV